MSISQPVLALLCIFLAHSPLPSDLEALTRQLGDSDKWERREAVNGLAKFGGEEAFQLLVGALRDPAGEVADTAEWHVGRVTSQGSIDVLHGKQGLRSKADWVRLRAAGALARVEGVVDGEALIRLLSEKESPWKRAALHAIERQAVADHLAGDLQGKVRPALEKAHKRGRDDRVRAAALRALVALDPGGSVQLVLAALDDSAPPVRAAALGLGASLERLVAALDDDHLAVRVAAVNALADSQSAPAARALSAHLEGEVSLRVQWRIVDQLQALSGLAHRRDPRPWQAWSADLAQDWHPEKRKDSGSASRDDQSAAFAGLPILSERITFLIDLSGSMWKPGANGQTRKAVVEVQLRQCLEKLPENTRFNLIPYTADPIPWKDKLQPATKRNTAKALKWFESRKDQGTGDFWDAFQEALEDPAVDTIVMLGDGSPSGGVRFHYGLLPGLVEREARDRGVAVDSILVSASRMAREAWGEVSERTGGRMVTADL
jgi:HEAT repeat protein